MPKPLPWLPPCTTPGAPSCPATDEPTCMDGEGLSWFHESGGGAPAPLLANAPMVLSVKPTLASLPPAGRPKSQVGGGITTGGGNPGGGNGGADGGGKTRLCTPPPQMQQAASGLLLCKPAT